jgi:AAA15 family ATPase/GTPase
MKLVELRIRNFRCYKEEFTIDFNSLTAIIAKNDVGKSTILEALDAFFNLEKLESDDRSTGLRNNDPIEITCIFDDIPTSLIVDTDNLIYPHNEYLLNSNGKLEIMKVFSASTPKCEEIFLRAVHPQSENFNDLFSLTIGNLRSRARDLNVDLSGVNEAVKSSIRHAIWSSVQTDMLNLMEVQINVKDTIWKQLQNVLPLYQLFKADRSSSDQDEEAQDPIKFAIKEALSQKNAELEAIGSFVKEQVKQVTLATIEKLREMDPDLAGELNPDFSSFNWGKVFSVSLTSDDQIPLNKRGSGVRRLFLINFFRAKAEQQASNRSVQDIIFAIEEPETSQHPNNQLLLLNALQELSEEQSSQVIFTTHNPLLARKIDSKNVRFISKNDLGVRFIASNNNATFETIRENLGILSNHNICVFVGVEGPNDIEFFNRISEILSQSEADIPNLKAAESQGRLVYIPMGGSTLELWTNRLEGLDIAEIHIMDRDNPPPQRAKYQDAADSVNARGGNAVAYITNHRETENYIHVDAINEEFNIQIAQPLAFDDVPLLVAEAVHTASGSPFPWLTLDDDKKSHKESRAKKRLNRGAVSRMNAIRLNMSDPNNDIRIWLRHINRHLE